jgi:hypothetical protein
MSPLWGVGSRALQGPSFDSPEATIVIGNQALIAADFTWLVTTLFDESTARVALDGTVGPQRVTGVRGLRDRDHRGGARS